MSMTNRASRMFSISKNSDQTNSKAQLWLTLKLNQEVFSYLRLKQWNLSIILVSQLTILRRMVANQQHSISQMVVGNALSVKITTSRVEKSATDARKSDPDRIWVVSQCTCRSCNHHRASSWNPNMAALSASQIRLWLQSLMLPWPSRNATVTGSATDATTTTSRSKRTAISVTSAMMLARSSRPHPTWTSSMEALKTQTTLAPTHWPIWWATLCSWRCSREVKVLFMSTSTTTLTKFQKQPKAIFRNSSLCSQSFQLPNLLWTRDHREHIRMLTPFTRLKDSMMEDLSQDVPLTEPKSK